MNASDYFPFGMMMPGRQYSDSSNYRYGFNGKENDNEVKGEGNQQDYGMRVYDPRLGKFLSVDQITEDFPWYSPYQFAGNTPLQAIDLDGQEPQGYKDDNPYGASHPGTAVIHIASDYDKEALYVKFDGVQMGLMHVYMIEDIDKKTYLIFETATGAKKSQWYVEYDKDGNWKGNVKSFDWQTPPNAADAITAITVIPLIVGPAAVEYGPWMVYRAYKIVKEQLDNNKNSKIGDNTPKQKDEVSSAEAPREKITIDQNRLEHIFRNKKNHLPEASSENIETLENVANDPNNLLGPVDKNGNQWYGKSTEDGRQIWVEVRDRKIINGGVNETPKKYSSATGLSKETHPNKSN